MLVELLLLQPHLVATKPWKPKSMVHSLTLSPNILWWPNMSQRINGSNSRESKQKPQDSPSFRLLHVLSNLTTNTVVSMLVIGTLTRTLLLCLILLSRSIMESSLVLSTHLTWMLQRSREMLLLMCLSILAEFVLVAPLMALVCLPVLPSNSVLVLRT